MIHEPFRQRAGYKGYTLEHYAEQVAYFIGKDSTAKLSEYERSEIRYYFESGFPPTHASSRLDKRKRP